MFLAPGTIWLHILCLVYVLALFLAADSENAAGALNDPVEVPWGRWNSWGRETAYGTLKGGTTGVLVTVGS